MFIDWIYVQSFFVKTNKNTMWLSWMEVNRSYWAIFLQQCLSRESMCTKLPLLPVIKENIAKSCANQQKIHHFWVGKYWRINYDRDLTHLVWNFNLGNKFHLREIPLSHHVLIIDWNKESFRLNKYKVNNCEIVGAYDVLEVVYFRVTKTEKF